MKIINLITYYISKLLKKALISSIKSSYIHKKSKVEAQSNIINTKWINIHFVDMDVDI